LTVEREAGFVWFFPSKLSIELKEGRYAFAKTILEE
jgi:hypothetical protein